MAYLDGRHWLPVRCSGNRWLAMYQLQPRRSTFKATLSRLLTASPEIAAAAMQVRRAQAAFERAQVEPMPNVNVQGLVNWQDNGIGGKPDGDIAVTVPIPIFDRNQGAIQRAQQELTAARRAESQVELELQQRLAPIFEQYSNAHNQVKRYCEQILPSRRRVT